MKRKPTLAALAALALILALPPQESQARITLVTLPDRDKIMVQLSRGNHTLVEEQRVLNLKKGDNLIDFAWQNRNIDGSSIQIRIVESAGKVNILNVSYPPNETALTWEISCEKSEPVTVRISYLIRNLGATYSYLLTADNDEKHLLQRCYSRITNGTGERFEELLVRYGFGKDFKIDLEPGESRKVLSMKYKKVPIVKQYIYDHKWGEYARMHYHLVNSKKNGMGGFAFKPGKARIYMKDSKGEEVFLGEDWAGATPRGEAMDLFVGLARDVKIKRDLMEKKIIKKRGNLYDIKKVYKFELQNFKNEAVTLKIKEHFQGQWDLEDVTEGFEPEIVDTQNATFTITLPKRDKTKEKVEKTIVTYTVFYRNLW